MQQAVLCAVVTVNFYLSYMVVLFLIPAVVSLVPGGTLYYAMSYAVQGDLEMSGSYGAETVQYVLGIACGMCIIWALFTTIRPRKN